MARCFYQLLVVATLCVLLGLPVYATVSQWSPRATRVVFVDTCSSILVTSDACAADTGLVMIYQADASVLNGTGLADTSTAGRWCIQRIVHKDGSMLLLDGLSMHVDVEALTQVVPVISASHIHVDTNIVVRSFVDGCGGVVAIRADTVTLDACIDATGSGFAGGLVSLSSYDTNVVSSEANWTNGLSGEKGHGPLTRTVMCAGYAASVLGGGGGNARNAGGGGGTLSGRGGNGGNQTDEYGALDNGGRGGLRVESLANEQLLLGGGGGGGHQNDFLGSDGGNGGGVVAIITPVMIITERGSIICRGADAHTANSDGAGGGGAGGTILLAVDSLISFAQGQQHKLDVAGGSGGSTFSDYRCYGPGGGGGGGFVLTSISDLPTVVAVNLDGGRSGLSVGGGCGVGNDRSFGATNGQPGTIRQVGSVSNKPQAPCMPPDILVTVHDSSGNIGEKATVRISVECPSPLQEDVVVKLRIRARATVLWPIGQYWWSGRRYTTQYLSIQVPANTVDNIQTFIPYQCLLGDSMTVSVTIDSALTDAHQHRVLVVRNGTFTVTDVCTAQEQPRLFNPFASNLQSSSGVDNQETFMMFDLLGRTFQTQDLHSSTSWIRRRWRVNFPR